MADFRRVQPGEPITAAAVNALAERLERFANLSVADGGPLRLWSTPTGKALALAFPRDTLARLSGSASPYSWTEVLDAADGTYDDRPNANSGVADAYEVNGVAGLDGELVWLTWTAARDWRFQWVGHGVAPPCVSGRICVTVDSDGCASSTPVFGAVVTVTDSAEPPNPVGSCTTTGRITALALTNPGSGYTDGTGYPLTITGDGAGASATFDIIDGQVANLVLTDPGSDYTSATASFAAVGPGAGAAATATVKGQCCIEVPAPGVYHVNVHVPGAADRSTTVNALCNQDNHASASYPGNSLGTAQFLFRRCTPEGFTPVAGATLSLTGAGAASATGDSNGEVHLRLGVGSYTATITYPSGASRTLSFDVHPCATTTITTTSVTSICFTTQTDAPGCTGTISIVNDDDGTPLGSGTITTSFDGTNYTGDSCIPIAEVFLGSLNQFGATVIWPNLDFLITAIAACYPASSPLIIENPGPAC